MTARVELLTDVHCPWATVAIHRLRRARERHRLDVVFDQRAWPSTFLPAFELVAAARRALGLRAAEDVDYARHDRPRVGTRHPPHHHVGPR